MNIRSHLCKAACITLLASASTSAFAKESGFYLGVGIGQSTADLDNSPTGYFRTSHSVTTDENDVAWSLSAGYRFNPYIGLEIGLSDLGDADTSERGAGQVEVPSQTGQGVVNQSTSVRGAMLAVVGAFPFGNFEVFAKAGAMKAEISVVGVALPTLTLPFAFDSNISKDAETTESLYGVGVGYTAGESLHFKVEWVRIPKLGDDVIGEVDVDVASAGFQYRF